MVILAIDPGPEESACLAYDGKRPVTHIIGPNEAILEHIAGRRFYAFGPLVIEGIACYGMPVGAETFTTCIWIGRFIQAWGREWELVYRQDVKLHLCKSARAKDGMVRQALIDKFGPSKAKAIGLKATPGPLYGISKHCWSALAVAVTYCEKLELAKAV
jgi:hypothetical protein